jgi:DNA-binding LytR/AlgR family response regulator
MNCLIVDDDEIAQAIIQRCIEQTDFLTLRHTCLSAIDAAAFLRKTPVDLIFLDIEMPEMNGIEFLKTFSEHHEMPQVILQTSHKNYAIDAFDYDVTDYLIKPITYARFLRAAMKAKEFNDLRHEQRNARLDDVQNPQTLFVKADSKITNVNLSEILWIEALADYVTIQTPSQKFVVHATMKSMEEKLPMTEFSRVHRSHIIRVDKIDYLEGDSVVVGRKVIPIGASYKAALLKRLNVV